MQEEEIKKHCYKCDKYYPISFFHKDNNACNKLKIRRMCKGCSHIARKEYYKRTGH